MCRFRFLLICLAALCLSGCLQDASENTAPPQFEQQIALTLPAQEVTPTARPSVPSIPTGTAFVPALPEGLHLTVPVEIDSVGWASDLDGRMHYQVPDIHAGGYRGNRYVGAFRFDLADVPVQGELRYAAVGIWLSDATRLGESGEWKLQFLLPDAIPDWYALTFDSLEQTAGALTFGPDLTASQIRQALSQYQPTLFVLDPTRLALLQPYLAGGLLPFRLDGPTGEEDNLVTWDSGVRLDGQAERVPRLHLVFEPDSTGMRIVTSTPTPENVLTLAAQVVQITALTTRVGTLTPVPTDWVTPEIVTSTSTPANEASATFEAEAAQARRFVFGPETPTPANLWTATATPTATETAIPTAPPGAVAVGAQPLPLLVPITINPARQPTPTPSPTPSTIPRSLLGKIAFYSDWTGNAELYVINPDGSGLARLTDSWFYAQAVKRDRLSSDQRFRAFVRSAPNASGGAPAIFAYDDFYRSERQVSTFGNGIAYDPVWSPISEQIALVSNDSNNDEIWVINRDGTGLQQLTQDSHSWWDKHPSWSPDGRSLVFWSNRSGLRQLWLMAADGSGQTQLIQPDANNWDPVWIKYPDPPRYAFDE